MTFVPAIAVTGPVLLTDKSAIETTGVVTEAGNDGRGPRIPSGSIVAEFTTEPVVDALTRTWNLTMADSPGRTIPGGAKGLLARMPTTSCDVPNTSATVAPLSVVVLGT